METNQIHEAAHKFREAVEKLTGDRVLITWCVIKKEPFNPEGQYEISGGHSITETDWEPAMMNHALLSSSSDLMKIYLNPE